MKNISYVTPSPTEPIMPLYRQISNLLTSTIARDILFVLGLQWDRKELFDFFVKTIVSESVD